MGGNRYCICHQECQLVRLGLLFKSFVIFCCNGQAMCFEPKPRLLVVVSCIGFCLHLVHYCENWGRKNSSFKLVLHIWWFWFKVTKI
jgi:hypothetical protein